MKTNYYLAALAIAILPPLHAQNPARGEYRYPVQKLQRLNYTPFGLLSVAPDGTQMAVDPQGNILNGTKYAWQRLAGNLVQVSAGSRDEIWGVNAAHAVFRWNGTTWITMPGSLQQVVVARGGGLVMGIEWAAPNKLVRWDAATGRWIPLDGAPPIVQLAVGSPNHVMGITATGELYKLRRPSWTEWRKLKGTYKQISVGEDGTFGGVATDGTVGRRTNDDVVKEEANPNITPTLEPLEAPAVTIEIVNANSTFLIDKHGTIAEALPLNTAPPPVITNSNLTVIGSEPVVDSGFTYIFDYSSVDPSKEQSGCIPIDSTTMIDLSKSNHHFCEKPDRKVFRNYAETCPEGSKPYEGNVAFYSSKCSSPKFSKIKGVNNCTANSAPTVGDRVLPGSYKGGCAEGGSPKPEPYENPQISGNGTACAPRTFTNRSHHSSVYWSLPGGKLGEVVKVAAGAHNRYVFPACNRVYWTDLVFTCLPGGGWTKTFGNYDADALCHGSPGRNFYQSISDRGIADK